MSKILRDSHKYILNKLPDTIRKEFVFSGGTALAEYYFQHRLSDDLDFFGLTTETKAPVEDIYYALNLIGKTAHEHVYSREIFITDSCGEKIKIDFCPLHFKRLNPPKYENAAYLVDSIEDLAANKILAICGRTEPKDFIDIYFFHKFAGYDIQTLVALAEKKHHQAYKYLLRLDRVETINFDKNIYKIIVDFSEADLKDYFRIQNKLIKPASIFSLYDKNKWTE